MNVEEKLDEANEKLEKIEIYLQKKLKEENKYNSRVKNSHLHIMVETDIVNRMKKVAEADGISLSEWCRRKLREDSQLDRIESKLDKLIKP